MSLDDNSVRRGELPVLFLRTLKELGRMGVARVLRDEASEESPAVYKDGFHLWLE